MSIELLKLDNAQLIDQITCITDKALLVLYRLLSY